MSEELGSSPFVERPMSPESAKTQTIALKFKMNSMQNQFEIDRLSLERQVSVLDKKYRATLDDLEKAVEDTKYLYSTNGELETRLRALEQELATVKNESSTENDHLMRQLDERESELEELDSSSRSKISFLENKFTNLQIEADGSKTLLKRYEEEVELQNQQIRELQLEAAQRDDLIANLKASRVVMAHHNFSTEELTELTTLSNLLKEQMSFSKNLERANLEQANELKKLRFSQESRKFLQAENEDLRRKTERLATLESRVQDLELENVELQSQLCFWEDVEIPDGNRKKTPDEVVREWALFKTENLKLISENSKFQLDLTNLHLLNDEMALERNQILDLNKNYETSILNLKRLNYEIEQQKLLSFEECKILRKQLDEIMPLAKVDGAEEPASQQTLDNLVQQYKEKTEDLTNELKKLNKELIDKSYPLSTNKKRKTSDDVALNYSQRLNELQLQNLELNRKLSSSTETIAMLETKIEKLNNLDQKKVRILQLRDNPFFRDQLVKRERLDLLLKENEDLITTKNLSNESSVPKSIYERLKFDMSQLEDEVFKLNKKITRLREVFNKKSMEFIETVNSLLGFKLEFKSDGKVKMIPCYKPDKFLLADLVNDSMKSNLQQDITGWDELLQDMVFEKGQMPVFLATLTIRLWEQSKEKVTSA
ncbi:LAME_0C08878g1_1 [Lachancea meyersii CBS 8951]|uniref:Spindle assembly checkpoint component MAD1 n=1 Tax=Lachancea meyersii CBS 8951 TaxID=1266667 RepID=A0A1G4J3U4_9SACH|nr:LAME_0C08878g1_1 [Lachancea meyersii CBS 8951]